MPLALVRGEQFFDVSDKLSVDCEGNKSKSRETS